MKLSATRKILSALLAWILTFSSLPLSVIAENIAIKQETNENTSEESLAANEDVFIVQEDTTKRDEFEKHYICSDGTYVVASYAEAIHYKDDNGEWVDVDSRPVQTTEGDYTARNGNFGISVPSSTGDGYLMRMDKGEHSLSWTLSANKKAGTIKMDSSVSTMAQKPVQSQKMQVGATQRPEIIVSNTEQPRENNKVLRDEATFDLPNVSGKVRYDDLFGADEGVSVVYTTYRNKIEEDIYIEKPTDITSFSMEVAAPDLTPRLNADNSVDFLDNDGKMCYHVGIPYMMDADFAVLNDIETTVTSSGDAWIITYIPDVAWFTSEERVYPILLDPSITTNEYRTNIQDTYVEEGDSTVHSSEQLLYINGGTGNRKAVIRFLTLPAIDDTMPLISANLTLYSQYSPFSDVFLKLSYTRDNVSTSISSYTYAAAANATSLYTSYGTLVTGSTSVTFNLTNCIYQMYESGRDDLILGYSNESDTTFCYPFHSVDTTTNYKPTLKVVYGYSLPETESSKLGNGKIIALRNVGTGAYMTANESLGSNVYQQNVEELTNNQWFRMKYMSDTGGYRLYAMGSSSGKVVGIQPTNGIVYGTKNVSLYTPDNPNTQEWLIIPVSTNQFRIVSRTNTSKCLTAYPGNTGSATTTVASTSGNVYATTVSVGNNNQIWCLTDQNNDDIFLDLLSSDIENGEYYVINNYTGRYLYKHSTMQGIRGTMESIGENNVTFKITNLQNGYCTIQTQNGYFLYAYSDDPGSSVRMSSMDDSIPDAYQWRVFRRGGGEFTIQNKFGGYYLSDDGPVDSGQPYMYLKDRDTADLETNQRQSWRLIDTSIYDEPTNFSFDEITVCIGNAVSPLVTSEPNTAYSVDADDFIYSLVTGSDRLSVHQATGEFTALASGSAIVKAVHKTTGLQTTFSIDIDNLLIYQTRDRERLGFADAGNDNDITPIIAEDLTYGQKDTYTLLSNGTLISNADLYNSDGNPKTISERVTTIKNFFVSQISYDPTFTAILNQMVDHFVDGTGEDYSNTDLTNAVKNHIKTQNYANAVVDLVKQQVTDADGNIVYLYYDEQLWLQPSQRKDHVLVKAMRDEISAGNSNLYLPSYGYDNGMPGLTLAIDGWYGNKIEIESFFSDSTGFSGTLRFTFYDHFGLDTPDLSTEKYGSIKAGTMPGFREWYILQHWNDLGYSVQPQPFVTIVSYTVSFSGTY